ncbi:hypothetical protein Tco_0527350 [Tanacetum coccineum]
MAADNIVFGAGMLNWVARDSDDWLRIEIHGYFVEFEAIIYMMNTHQQSLAYAGLENSPPMLEKGSYVPWPSQFMRYIEGKKEIRKVIMDSIMNGPYVIKEIHDSTSTLENPIKRLQVVDDLTGDEKK